MLVVEEVEEVGEEVPHVKGEEEEEDVEALAHKGVQESLHQQVCTFCNWGKQKSRQRRTLPGPT